MFMQNCWTRANGIFKFVMDTSPMCQRRSPGVLQGPTSFTFDLNSKDRQLSNVNDFKRYGKT